MFLKNATKESVISINDKTSIWSWFSIIVILLLIVLFGVIDMRSSFMSMVSNQDKYLHFFTFFTLLFISRALFTRFSIYKMALATLAFSVLLELLQEFFTHGLRHFHFSDLLANVLGIGLALLIVIVIDRKKSS